MLKLFLLYTISSKLPSSFLTPLCTQQHSTSSHRASYLSVDTLLHENGCTAPLYLSSLAASEALQFVNQFRNPLHLQHGMRLRRLCALLPDMLPSLLEAQEHSGNRDQSPQVKLKPNVPQHGFSFA